MEQSSLKQLAKPMLAYFTIFVCGFSVAMAVFAPSYLYSRTQTRLIDDWRQIKLGMSIVDVNQRFGDTGYDFEVGQGWPAWATEHIPETLQQEHGLRVVPVEGFGPQLLLVLYDGNGSVVFVSSTST